MTSPAMPQVSFNPDLTVALDWAAPLGPGREPEASPGKLAAEPPAAPHRGAADPRTVETTLHNHPRAFINKRHEAILIRILDERIAPRLVDMYLAFRPRPSFQGLPPIKDEVCRTWVRHLIDNGINLVALSFEQGVAGHTAIFAMDETTCEMLVVVSPAYQNTGIGTELVRSSIQLAYEIGFEKVWLPVESTNVRARHVYKKCGFDYLPGKQAHELEMALDLRRYRDAVSAPVERIMNRDVASVELDDNCRMALDRMLDRGVASLPVVDGQGELQGVLSESELLVPSNLDKHVRDIFTRQPLAVCPECTIAKLVRLFQSNRIRSIPVVTAENRLAGVVGRRDILAYYAEHVR
jgi:CBS domain-containing protein